MYYTKAIKKIEIPIPDVDKVCSVKPSDDICSFGESNLVQRWYYDVKENICFDFLYDIECGSSGNAGNVFLTHQKCEQTCKNNKTNNYNLN